MSNEEDYSILDPSSGTTTMKGAEYKDGQLQIVELTPYTKSEETLPDHVVAEGSESSNEGLKYMQLDSSKNMVVDYLNLTFVRCDDGQESYRLVSNTESESGDDTTVTCVLADDGDVEGDADEQENSESYVMVEGDEGPLVFLQSSLQPTNTPAKPVEEKKSKVKALTPTEILEKAKALQKAKALMAMPPKRGPGRRRKSDLPSPHELLTSPQFKLFLYSCKLCSFRCNAIKELTAHKAAEHGSGGGRWARGGGGRGAAVTLQCARCPFRGHSHAQLMRHVKEKHLEADSDNTKVYLDSSEIEAADVLVCGACGFESSSRAAFKEHIEDAHGASSC